MKEWQSFLLVFAMAAFIAVYTGRNSLASFVWQKYRTPQVAVFLDRVMAVWTNAGAGMRVMVMERTMAATINVNVFMVVSCIRVNYSIRTVCVQYTIFNLQMQHQTIVGKHIM